MNKLDPSVKMIWSVGIFFRVLINSVILFLIEKFILIPNMEWIAPSGIIPGILFAIGIIAAFVFPQLQYKYWKFDIRDSEIYIERGVLTRIKTTAPYSRVQHIDVRQSMMERMTNLASLIIYTAGTRGADLTIPGLPEDYAESLRDELKKITSEDEL